MLPSVGLNMGRGSRKARPAGTAVIVIWISLATSGPARAGDAIAQDPAPAPEAKPAVRTPRDSWVLQIGLAHSADDRDHYAVSGLQGRFALFALDRRDKSDRRGDLGVDVGLYPYPMMSGQGLNGGS